MLSDSDTEGMIEVTGVDLRAFVQACYRESMPHGLGFLHFQQGDLNEEESSKMIDRAKGDNLCAISMDYVVGRSVKMTVFHGPNDTLWIRSTWFDHTPEQLERVLALVPIR